MAARMGDRRQHEEHFGHDGLVARTIAEVGRNRVGKRVLVVLHQPFQALQPLQPHGGGGETLGRERLLLGTEEILEIERVRAGHA